MTENDLVAVDMLMLEQMTLVPFLTESLKIEGIRRAPSKGEIDATRSFLDLSGIDTDAVSSLQAVYTPGKPLRDRPGMNVRIGSYVAPVGGPEIRVELDKLCRWLMSPGATPWVGHMHFERLHPFMDGNGRTGWAIWAWHMRRLGHDPFALGFLHSFYYQTLDRAEL